MRSTRILVTALLGALLISFPTQAAAPQVVASIPERGDGHVDPTLTEIRVTFDQPMNTSGFSWVTLGSGFPEISGEPSWIDPFTTVLPVTLEPGRDYWLLANSPTRQGFRNPAGEAASPYLLAFRTARTGTDVDEPSQEQREWNQRTYDQVFEIMTTFYSYKDRLNIDWAASLTAERERLLDSPNDFIFAARLIPVLEAAQDPHISVGVGDQKLPTHWAMRRPNYNLQAVLAGLTNVKQWSNAVASGETEEIGYIVIGAWRPEAAEAVAAVDSLRQKDAIIIDVRPNGGGNERIARELAGCFIDHPVDYAKSLTFDPETHAFTHLDTRTLHPNSNCETYTGTVVVLMGPQVMSSNEAFLLMMRETGAILVGSPSYGSSGNPKPYELANGLILYVPQWQAMDMEGRLFEGEGIAPDILLDFPPDEFAEGDPLFDAALQTIRE